MDPDYNFQAALLDAEFESVETLAAGAAMYDQLGINPHIHAWAPRAGRDRIVNGTMLYPYECSCGATAWKEQWGDRVQHAFDETRFVDIRIPNRETANIVQDDDD